jgi:N-acetylmuramoyl-L-alanine amidase
MHRVKKIKFIAFGITLIALIFSPAFVQKTGALRTVVIDPGHGGRDPGCMGSTHKEKDVALAVALKLGKYIEGHMKDVKVIYTRTSDVFVDLEDRALIANKAKADLFISIHCNAAGKPVMITDPKTGKRRPKTYKNKKGKLRVVETTNPVPFGTETYVMGLKNEEGKMKVATRENSAIFLEDDYEKKYGGFDPESEESYIIMSNYTSAYVIQSANLAMKIQDEYARKAGRIDKGVHRQSIWVLWRTSMPSVLTEIGYLTNPLEEQFLGSDTGQDHLAMSLFRGLRKYRDELSGVKKDYDDLFENITPLENENIKAGLPPKAAEEPQDSDLVALELKVTQPPAIGSKSSVGGTERAAPEKTDSISPAKDIDTTNAAKIADSFRNRIAASEVKAEKPVEPVPVKVAKPAESVIFKVQFASTEVAINLSQTRFAQITDADFYREQNVLKYTSGKFAQLKDAVAHKNSLRQKGFPDCFVIAMKNGKRIDIDEAKKITGQ